VRPRTSCRKLSWLAINLETLSPVERAVFLLREVFDYGYDEIARVVGKSEANCRQIAARARRHIESRKPRFEASRRRREELARRFFQAVGEGDTEGLVGLLAADVVAYADGGGKTQTFTRPEYGLSHIHNTHPTTPKKIT
jgi:RNA polymerase sigma-70 factor (ECF subfamily)